ncbi:unnamed protein product, partial [Vitis vinifera]|uniref:Uncharacterized protein n=1 Tax=Vitis vinifera TaxID=29760 RepID=D7U1K0_VITVI
MTYTCPLHILWHVEEKKLCFINFLLHSNLVSLHFEPTWIILVVSQLRAMVQEDGTPRRACDNL